MKNEKNQNDSKVFNKLLNDFSNLITSPESKKFSFNEENLKNFTNLLGLNLDFSKLLDSCKDKRSKGCCKDCFLDCCEGCKCDCTCDECKDCECKEPTEDKTPSTIMTSVLINKENDEKPLVTEVVYKDGKLNINKDENNIFSNIDASSDNITENTKPNTSTAKITETVGDTISLSSKLFNEYKKTVVESTEKLSDDICKEVVSILNDTKTHNYKFIDGKDNINPAVEVIIDNKHNIKDSATLNLICTKIKEKCGFSLVTISLAANQGKMTFYLVLA